MTFCKEMNDYSYDKITNSNQKMVKNMDTADKIKKTMDELRDFLVAKNEQYGDSVMKPIKIFSDASEDSGIRIRIDDKLNRLMQGNDNMETDEDVIKDLTGYLVLLLIVMREKNGLE